MNFPTPEREQHHFSNTVWRCPAGGPAPVLEGALAAANTDPERGDHAVWYRTENTPAGPVIVIGYTSEVTG